MSANNDRSDQQQVSIPYDEDLKGKVTQIVNAAINGKVTSDTSLNEQGLDSLAVMRLLVQLKSELGVTLKPRMLKATTKLDDLVGLVSQSNSKSVGTTKDQKKENRVSLTNADLIESFWSKRSYPFYWNCVDRWNVEGPIDAELVKTAFRALVERYEILRSAFVRREAGDVYLDTKSANILTFNEVAVNSETIEGFESAVKELVSKEYGTGFEFTEPTRIRVSLVKFNGVIKTLLVSGDHTVCDEHAMVVLFEEFGLLCNNQPPPPVLSLSEQLKIEREAVDQSEKSIQSCTATCRKLKKTEIVGKTPDLGEYPANVDYQLLTADEVQQLRKKANSLGVTLALMVTTAAAMAKCIIDGSDYLAASPVMSTRFEIGLPKAVSNFAKLSFFAVNVEKSTSLGDILKDFIFEWQELQERKNLAEYRIWRECGVSEIVSKLTVNVFSERRTEFFLNSGTTHVTQVPQFSGKIGYESVLSAVLTSVGELGLIVLAQERVMDKVKLNQFLKYIAQALKVIDESRLKLTWEDIKNQILVENPRP